ncbi:MAG: hypothetical protein ABMB14_17320, partial [Myxococcota bacterium]
MDHELVSFEPPRYVEQPGELGPGRLTPGSGSDTAPWMVAQGGRPARGRATPPSLPPERHGSRIASMIPRPSQVPREVVPSPPPPQGISPRTMRIVALAAGASMLAVFGTAMVGGVVAAAAIAYRPSSSAIDPSGRGASPVAVEQAAPVGGSQVDRLFSAPAGGAPTGNAAGGQRVHPVVGHDLARRPGLTRWRRRRRLARRCGDLRAQRLRQRRRAFVRRPSAAAPGGVRAGRDRPLRRRGRPGAARRSA